MALGTVTIVKENNMEFGPQRNDLVSFAGDGSYPTGGTANFQALYRAALGKGNLEIVGVLPQGTGGYTVTYNKATDKLQVFHGDNNNAADAPGVEVPNATDLSGTTFRCIVMAL